MAWITFSYDDGLKNNYDVALPLHEKYGIPASLAIITHRAVSPEYWDKYMSPFEIVHTDIRGHEIVSHGVYHQQKLTELSDDELDYELSHSQSVLNGFAQARIDSINIPFAQSNSKVIQKAKQYYRLIRLAGNELNPLSASSGIIHGFGLNNKTRFRQLESLIDKAMQKDKWLVLILHGICEGKEPAGMYSTASELLEKILARTRMHVDKNEIKPVLFRDVGE